MNKKNLAASTILNDIDSTVTAIDVDSAISFPEAPFYATIMPSDNISNSENSEIVLVDEVIDNAFIIQRGQYGTTPKAFTAGAVIANGFYVEDLEDAGKPNLIVTTTANPLDPERFICDYSSSEIRNALIEGRTVVMYFEDIIEKSGNQVYPLLKMTNDGAFFRRVQVATNKVRQIDIKVDYAKNVTFKEEVYNIDISIGENGNWFIDGQDTTKPSRGIQGPEGPVGPPGEAGAGLQITGSVPTYEALPKGLTEADAGKAYFVDEDGKLYIWSGKAFPMKGQGSQFRGPAGKDGENGAPGKDGAPGTTGSEGPAGAPAKINGVNTLRITDGDGITTSQSGSTLTIKANIDASMSDNSENPVQNKVAKAYIDSKTIVDTSMSDTSSNAVENKTIKKYVDAKGTYIAQPTEPTNQNALWVDTDDDSGQLVMDTQMSDTSSNAVQNSTIKKYVDNADKLVKDSIDKYIKDYLKLTEVPVTFSVRSGAKGNILGQEVKAYVNKTKKLGYISGYVKYESVSGGDLVADAQLPFRPSRYTVLTYNRAGKKISGTENQSGSEKLHVNSDGSCFFTCSQWIKDYAPFVISFTSGIINFD